MFLDASTFPPAHDGSALQSSLHPPYFWLVSFFLDILPPILHINDSCSSVKLWLPCHLPREVILDASVGHSCLPVACHPISPFCFLHSSSQSKMASWFIFAWGSVSLHRTCHVGGESFPDLLTVCLAQGEYSVNVCGLYEIQTGKERRRSEFIANTSSGT